MSLVTKKWSGRRLAKSSNGWSYSDGYEVTGVANEEEAIAALENDYPETIHNAESPISSLMYCESRNAEVTGFNFWTITVNYASTPEGRFFDHANPLDEPIKWRVVHGIEQISSPVDALGKPVLNCAGQAFSSDHTGNIRFITLIGQRIEPFFDLAKSIQFNNAINNTPLALDNNWTLEKGQACCRYMILISTVTGAEKYVITEYAIEIREGFVTDPDGYRDGFKLRILNEGTEGWYDDGNDGRVRGPLCRIRKDPATGQDIPEKVSSPVLLDSEGRPTGEGVYVMCPTTADSRGYIEAAANPTIFEGVVEDTDDATFIKIFPKGYVFKNLADLGL
jgi:hypothetical protein